MENNKNRENDSEVKNKDFNRRNFLTTSILAGAGLALSPFSGETANKPRILNEKKHHPLKKGKRKLGSLEVSAQGLGGLSVVGFYTGGPREQANVNRIYREAYEMGITLFDTAEVYGPFINEKQVGEAVAPFRKDVVLATKFGFDVDPDTGQRRGIDSRPKTIRKSVEGSLKRLRTDYIDLSYQHRVDPNVPIEDVAGTIQDLMREGKIRHWGLSEPGLKTVRRAHAVQPLTAIQNEYSPWTRNPEAEVLPLCEELGIGFVPWCPLGYGFFADAINENSRFSEGDFRAILPRITPENIPQNLEMLYYIQEWGLKKDATASQITLAWLQAQKPWVVPIPGTSNIIHLKENIGANDISFTSDELQEFNAGLAKIEILGAQNAGGVMTAMGVEAPKK
jgi:aryl-alcohol dehydrogenase-like predicted oxidoreductase